MDINLKISAQFEAVFLINGKFSEGGTVCYGTTDVVYITALPLDAVLLPYTIKLVGGTVKNNLTLAKCFKLARDSYFLKLLPRHNYVYSPENAFDAAQKKSKIERFFQHVKKGKLSSARELLSEDLNDSIDDKSLSAFFDGFFEIVSTETAGHYYLIKSDGEGVLYNFVTKGGLIDNILENSDLS